MGRRETPRKLGWRWRRNPLRRRTDVIEAWLGLVTAVLFCAVPAVGWWAGHCVDHTLQRVVRTQRAERTLVTAELVPAAESVASTSATATGAAAGARSGASRTGTGASAGSDTSGYRGGDFRPGDMLRWTAPGHSVHTASVPVDIEVRQDGRIRLWTDHNGKLVPPPLDTATATTHSVLAGMAAATTAGGLLLISHRVLAWRLMRRRLDSWERDWARVGQDWGRAGADG